MSILTDYNETIGRLRDLSVEIKTLTTEREKLEQKVSDLRQQAQELERKLVEYNRQTRGRIRL